MSRAREQTNRAMLRVRDTLDRDYDQDLDVEGSPAWCTSPPTT